MRTYSVEWNFKGHGWFEVEAETREQAIEIVYDYDNQKFFDCEDADWKGGLSTDAVSVEYDSEIQTAIAYYYGYAEGRGQGTSPSGMLEYLVSKSIPKDVALCVIQEEFNLDAYELEEYE
jgi:hypothetical protein